MNKLTLVNGMEITATEVIGVRPAQLVYKDENGKEQTVPENDVRQIEPPLEESLRLL
jgi:hypothetical protein